MTAPTAPIDSSLPPEGREIFYVLEDLSIWKTENLVASGAGVATWSESYTATSFESENGVTDGHFLRIIAASDTLVYVLGYATLDGSAYPYMLRSQNGGLTWAAFKVDDIALSSADYTVVSRTFTYTRVSGWAVSQTYEIPRLLDPDNTYSPWAMACKWTSTGGGDVVVGASSFTAGANTYNSQSFGLGGYTTPWASTNLLLGYKYAGAVAMLDDYFGVGGYSFAIGESHNMPNEANRVEITVSWSGMGWNYPALGSTTYVTIYIFYNVPSISMPKAFDVAKQNNNWLYVGLRDKIRASEDGGQTWFDFTTAAVGNGANDVHVDPQIPGAVYVWSDDGKLNLWLKSASGSVGTLNQTAIMTETANEDFLRIARDLNSGKLWAIPNGTTITMRENAANVNQKTGLVGGQGLHAYLGGYLIMVDNTDVYISNDYGVTWTAKKGGWATYSNGNNAHRIKSAT